MLKKIAITAILLVLFLAGSLIAEKYTYTIYLYIHNVNSNADIETWYEDMYFNQWQNLEVEDYSLSFYQRNIDVWPPEDPIPEKMWASGESSGSAGNYSDEDSCDASFEHPNILHLYLGVEPDPDPGGGGGE